MKRLLVATNCKHMVVGQMRRLGWNPDAIKGIVWVENNPATEAALALATKKALTRFTTQFYRVDNPKEGPDDTALKSLEKFEHVSMDEGMRWLMVTEKETT